MEAKAILEIASRFAGFTRASAELAMLSVIGTVGKVATDDSAEFLRIDAQRSIVN